MLKIVVTGCCGYIGSKLTLRLLGQGHSVIGIDNLLYQQSYIVDKLQFINNKETFIFDRNFHFMEDDIYKNNWLQYISGADVIIHLAALVGPVCNELNKTYVEKVNTDSVKNLVNILKPNQHLIYPNTNSCYGTTDKNTVCTETSDFNPISIYGKTKCNGEIEAIRHSNTTCFRLATVFGASLRNRLDLLVNHWTWESYFNKSLTVYEPEFRRNFVHVDDVVDGIIHAIYNKNVRGIYNLGLDKANTTKKQLAELICKKTGAKLSFSEGEDPDKRDYVVSSDKLYNTGFRPRITLEQGINEIISLCKFAESTNQKKNIEFYANNKNAAKNKPIGW